MGLVLTVKETANRMQVSVGTIYKLCSTGKLPHLRIRGTIRIDWDTAIASLTTELMSPSQPLRLYEPSKLSRPRREHFLPFSGQRKPNKKGPG